MAMKVLELDIETAPHSAFIWSLWQKYIAPDHIEVPGYTLCFAAKWQGSDEIMFYSIWKDGLLKMIEAAWDLMNEADAIVHYNGKKFDMPMIHGEFVLNGFVPPAPYEQIDLLPVVRKNFRFPSNKLDYVCKRLKIGSKVSHRGMELWCEVMEGDKKACAEMEEYNIQDVHLLGPLYTQLLPWMSQHPNRAMYQDTDRPTCPNCGGNHLVKNGTRKTKTQMYTRYQCQDCGTWSQSRYSELPPEKRHDVLKQIPI